MKPGKGEWGAGDREENAERNPFQSRKSPISAACCKYTENFQSEIDHSHPSPISEKQLFYINFFEQ